MKQRLSAVMAVMLCVSLLCGCWDYRGLDELTIVTGIAIDISEDDPERLVVNFEIVDLVNDTTQEEPTSKLLESTGKTIAEAVYRCNEKLHNNMYFGNCEVLVVSHQVAETKGLRHLLDSLLRDNKMRDNLHILISGEDTAKEILVAPEDKDTIVSIDMNKNIDTEEHTANSTRALELYQVYNLLALNTANLLLPVIRSSADGDGELQLEGMAIFSDDKMTDEMDHDHMPYYLLATSNIKGGGYFIEVEDGNRYAILANRRSRSDKRVQYDGETLTLVIDIRMLADVSEFSPEWHDVKSEAIRDLERRAEQFLREQVYGIADHYRRQDVDVFEFGDTVRNWQPHLWDEIQDDWFAWLKNAEIVVNCDVKIDNTGIIEHF